MAMEMPYPNVTEAREILDAFLLDAQLTDVHTYEDLQLLMGQRVVGALAGLIVHNGHPPKNPESRNLAVISETQDGIRIRGAVSAYSSHDTKQHVEIITSKRRPIRFRRQQLLSISTEGVGPFSMALEGDDMYTPFQASGEFMDFFAGTIGSDTIYGEGYETTGFRIASEAAQSAPVDLAGFLRVSTRLTRGLLQIDPLQK